MKLACWNLFCVRDFIFPIVEFLSVLFTGIGALLLKGPRNDLLGMSDDIEASKFDIGTTSIRLVRVGNVIQIWFSSALEAKYLYSELAERYKRAEDALKAGGR